MSRHLSSVAHGTADTVEVPAELVTRLLRLWKGNHEAVSRFVAGAVRDGVERLEAERRAGQGRPGGGSAA